MNLTTVFQPLIFTLILLSSQSPLLSQVQDKGDAYCEQKVKYPKSNDEYPATMIKNINGNYTPLIYWVYEVAGETPKDRCEKISKIIQARFDSKTWNKRYFRTGSKDEYSYPVICFIGEKEQSCNERNIIIKLRETENAARVLDEMLAFKQRTDLKLTGEARSYCDEVSEDICYDIDKFLEAVADFHSGQ